MKRHQRIPKNIKQDYSSRFNFQPFSLQREIIIKTKPTLKNLRMGKKLL